MGANLSGRYGGVVVHDSIETIVFSHLISPIWVRAISFVLALLVFGLLFAKQLTQREAATAILVAAIAGCAWVLRQLDIAHKATLTLRIPEHTWAMEKVFPTGERMAAHGNFTVLKEIVVRKIARQDEATVWFPVLVWESKNKTAETSQPYKYELGHFDREEEAWAFAEALGSRLGIPVADEPHPCQKVARRASSQVQQARETLRNTLSWFRRRPRTG